MMVKQCHSCGKSFTTTRVGKRSCSATCLKALNRGSKTRWAKGGDIFGEFWYRIPRLNLAYHLDLSQKNEADGAKS